MVDDPYLFGQIAAANALSDVYAMGGYPLTAMNIVCYPKCDDIGVLSEILRGGADKIKESGAILVGGHTVDDNEPKYGLSVTGIVHPERVITNQAAQPGDRIYLTKPLGTGIIATAIKGEMAGPEAVEAAIKSMALLNKNACDAMVEAGVKMATDLTGFGLLGHLMEICDASGVRARVFADKLEILPETERLAAMGLVPEGAYNNREYLQDRIRIDDSLNAVIRDIMYSPETSGGLLIAVAADRYGELESAFRRHSVDWVFMGQFLEDGPSQIEVVRS